MRSVTYAEYKQWVDENSGGLGVRHFQSTISEPPVIVWYKDDVIMARCVLTSPAVTYELSKDANVCTHTFGTEDNYDGGRSLVTDQENLFDLLKHDAKVSHDYLRDFDAFTYCPDCGMPLAAIIEQVNQRVAIALAVPKVILYPNCQPKAK